MPPRRWPLKSLINIFMTLIFISVSIFLFFFNVIVAHSPIFNRVKIDMIWNKMQSHKIRTFCKNFLLQQWVKEREKNNKSQNVRIIIIRALRGSFWVLFLRNFYYFFILLILMIFFVTKKFKSGLKLIFWRYFVNF